MTLVDWSYCRSCNAKIYWLKNDKTGKPAPIDVAPSDAGNVEIDLSAHTYHVLGRPELLQSPTYPKRHTSHFQTCPSAGAWKRHGSTGMRGPRTRVSPKGG